MIPDEEIAHQTLTPGRLTSFSMATCGFSADQNTIVAVDVAIQFKHSLVRPLNFIKLSGVFTYVLQTPCADQDRTHAKLAPVEVCMASYLDSFTT